MNPETGNGTRQQPGNAVCRHQPSEPVAALTHVCKRCGVSIDWRPCMACDGMGRSYLTDSRCCVCRGTGVDRWEAVQ